MSTKPRLKKELQKLSKEQLIEQILDLYDTNKSVKELYDFYLNPRKEKDLVEKYKKAIYNEFNIQNPMRAGLKYSVAKKAISDFKGLSPSAESLADVMLTLPEAACRFTYEYGDMTEGFYNSAVTNFETAMKYISANGLLDNFELRVEQCVRWASPCGYGFADEIADICFKYYPD